MLDGWYCRSMAANAEEEEDEEEEEESQEDVNYRSQYRILKRKLKFLLYENECFQEALRSSQRRLLKANRDRSFLLDRLLQYEKVEVSTSESEETESSDDADAGRPDTAKRKKLDSGVNSHGGTSQSSGINSKNQNLVKKKRPPPKTPKQNNVPPLQVFGTVSTPVLSDGHVTPGHVTPGHVTPGHITPGQMTPGQITPEEVERHLESRQSYMEPVPEKALPSVPTEMFSNDPSLDSESNEIFELETSPSNMGEDCLSVDMIPE